MPGNLSSMSAAAPLTWAQDALVPEKEPNVKFETLSGPMISGFFLPSLVGPRELNGSWGPVVQLE